MSSGESLCASICAITRSFAIASRVWDMEPSLVGVAGQNNRFLLSKLLFIIYIFSLPWVYITLVVRQSHGTRARIHDRKKQVQTLCGTEHRGKEVPGTCYIQPLMEDNRSSEGIHAHGSSA